MNHYQIQPFNDDRSKKYQTEILIDDFHQEQQYMKQTQNMSSLSKLEQYQTKQTTNELQNIRKQDYKGIKTHLNDQQSKNLDTQDQNEYDNTQSSDNLQSFQYTRQFCNQLSNLDIQLYLQIKKQQIQQFINKISPLFQQRQAEVFKILQSHKIQNNQYQTIQDNINSNSSFKYKTPYRTYQQRQGLYTSDKNGQISTGNTEYLSYEDKQIRNQSNINYSKIMNSENNEFIREQISKIQQQYINQQSNQKNQHIRENYLNDKFNNGYQLQMGVQNNGEILDIQETNTENKRNNDRLLEQLEELRCQNIIQGEKLQEFERKIKLEKVKYSDYQRETSIQQNKYQATNLELLQRIKDQEKMIEQKTLKNTELQNQLLSLLNSNKQFSDEQSKNSKSSQELYQIQIKEQTQQIEYLQRQNDELRQQNRVILQEKELSLIIIKQLEIKFDEEREKSEKIIQDIKNTLSYKQQEYNRKEEQLIIQQEELIKQIEQTKQFQTIKYQEEIRTLNTSNQQEMLYIIKRFQHIQQKQFMTSFKILQKITSKQLLKNAFKKIVQASTQRINHRIDSKINRSISPVSRSENKRDLNPISPIRDRTYIERRRLISFGKYLFLKYKKVMMRIFFQKIKQSNIEGQIKQYNCIETKSNILKQRLIQIVKVNRSKQVFKIWKQKTNILKLIQTIQQIQLKKLMGSAFNNIIAVSEQNKNNSKLLKFGNSLQDNQEQDLANQKDINQFKIQELISYKFSLLSLSSNKRKIFLSNSLGKQFKFNFNTLRSFKWKQSLNNIQNIKWRSFIEMEAIYEQANHETESIQEKKKILDEEINQFFDKRIDFSYVELALRQRQTQRQADRKYQKSYSTKMVESSNSSETQQQSQIENMNEEMSFRANKIDKIALSEINTQFYDNLSFRYNNNITESNRGKNLCLNEYDLNQENMLFSNDIHRKNLSNRSCQSYKSQNSSYKSSQSSINQEKNNNQRNIGDKSPKMINSDKFIKSMSHKYLSPNQKYTFNQYQEGTFFVDINEMEMYNNAKQEQKTYFKK